MFYVRSFLMSGTFRYSLFIFAVIVQSSGIPLVVRSLLGISPTSSLPYVISVASNFSLGQMTFAFNMLLILAQYMLLRSKFHKIQLLQVPMTIVFSFFIDVFMDVWSWVNPVNYFFKLVALLMGTALIAFGIAVQGIANVLMLPGEGLVYAVSRYFRIDLSKVKTGNDVILVVCAAVLSVIYLGIIDGIREGTLIAALLTGVLAKFFLTHLGAVDEHGRLIFRPHW